MSQRGPVGGFPRLSFLRFFTLSTNLMNMPPKSSLDIMSVLFLVLPLGETASCAGREMNPTRDTNKYQPPPVPSLLSFPSSCSHWNEGRFTNFSSRCSFTQDCLPSRPLGLKPTSLGFLFLLAAPAAPVAGGQWRWCVVGKVRSTGWRGGRGAFKEQCKAPGFWEAVSPVYCR